ncbi:hypothetical protein B0H16DRAFT_1586581 [Mycena metata]|uniref:Uncharacterized protein n=1 Tax=Mycena metata TaxID=1033252 RepID=A0AAD7HX01_9AGAR|nr:hypothetical protein B0H16DRAFT_1586581 [Mycena metata]
MAALEGGVAGVATASGTAAIAMTLTTLAGAGDNIVTAYVSFVRRAYQQFKSPKEEVRHFVEFLDPVEPHINDKTKTISVGTLAAVGLPSHPSRQQTLRMLRPNAVEGVLTFCVRQGG